MIICATLKEAVAQRKWLGLNPMETLLVTNPRSIERMHGIPPEHIESVYVALSAPPDLLEKVDSYIHYLDLKVVQIH